MLCNQSRLLGFGGAYLRARERAAGDLQYAEAEGSAWGKFTSDLDF